MLLLPGPESEPTGQGVHDNEELAAIDVENFPAVQNWQVVAPRTSAYVPGLHDSQNVTLLVTLVTFDIVKLYFPGGHINESVE
jgi:hypothetical protein